MASIHIESKVAVSADTAWRALRQVGDADKLFAPVLDRAELHGDMRMVHFTNGPMLHERIIDVDEPKRRVAYSVLDSPGLTYHHAAMQIVDDGPQRCRFVWTTDFLPAESAASLRPVIEAGAQALKTNLETQRDRSVPAHA
ncbi:MAG TPA: SRPBCC family protein [Vicinamibacterales bacterium]|jgi:hypothetical protein|nr:SRPBCC family protein [Vicinamibacterales bacterium]